MAVVSVLSYSILDADGNVKSMPIYIPAGATVANIQLFSDALAPILDDVLDGKIDGVTLSIGLTLPGGLKITPVANSNVQEGALLGFDVAASNYKHSIFVPAWATGFFTGNEVDTVATEVGALATQLVTGSNSIAPSDRAGLDLVALTDGKKRFRK